MFFYPHKPNSSLLTSRHDQPIQDLPSIAALTIGATSDRDIGLEEDREHIHGGVVEARFKVLSRFVDGRPRSITPHR
jgi:hypothetical protein